MEVGETHMEGPIQREATARDVSAHVRSVLAGATSIGGDAKRICEERLGPVLSLVEMVTAQLDKAREDAGPILAAVSANSRRARAVLERVNDDLWGAVGRPASDATLSLLFPGGTSYY